MLYSVTKTSLDVFEGSQKPRKQHCPNPFLKCYSGYDVKNRLERAYDKSRVPSSGQGRDGEPDSVPQQRNIQARYISER